MKAVFDGVTIAEAEQDDLVRIEGNWYFPPAALAEGALVESPTPYTCPWKGEAQYFSVSKGGAQLADGAWSYPTPKPTAIERVGADFSGYVAFDRKVQIVD
ncbi:DUF427 domain-containing protein [Microbacterium sp. HD4P20]|uniref:DUF427 domain-containing protein n=1 Tax=Microbacterium sp. HD4P20 TaxID=2864874 RepID=UPI001C640E72|nr:DUF427 domain-containing protein [Microbacterium sp. HD4P20]MCP2637781.1 DUF427 domain-containing protein [Microbacterium sp. HD4P20]